MCGVNHMFRHSDLNGCGKRILVLFGCIISVKHCQNILAAGARDPVIHLVLHLQLSH